MFPTVVEKTRGFQGVLPPCKSKPHVSNLFLDTRHHGRAATSKVGTSKKHWSLSEQQAVLVPDTNAVTAMFCAEVSVSILYLQMSGLTKQTKVFLWDFCKSKLNGSMSVVDFSMKLFAPVVFAAGPPSPSLLRGIILEVWGASLCPHCGQRSSGSFCFNSRGICWPTWLSLLHFLLLLFMLCLCSQLHALPFRISRHLDAESFPSFSPYTSITGKGPFQSICAEHTLISSDIQMVVSSPSALSSHRDFNTCGTSRARQVPAMFCQSRSSLVGVAQSFHSPWKFQSLYSVWGEVVAEQRIQGTNPQHTKS